ncbi:hypothetical protein IWX49DRAFT_420852 [Phyllosticta citricarpa]
MIITITQHNTADEFRDGKFLLLTFLSGLFDIRWTMGDKSLRRFSLCDCLSPSAFSLLCFSLFSSFLPCTPHAMAPHRTTPHHTLFFGRVCLALSISFFFFSFFEGGMLEMAMG